MNTVEIVKTLSKAFGPSGFEGGVRDVIRGIAEPMGYECTVDTLGNLICYKPGKTAVEYVDGAEPQKLLMAAHMDSLGFMVTRITEKGYIKFGKLGGIDAMDIVGLPVRFENGTAGTIHANSGTKKDALDFDKLYIDIGCTSKEDAEKLVSVGDAAVYDSPCYVTANGKYIVGPYMDDRACCAQMLMAMEKISEAEKAGEDVPASDLYFVFTVQEEVGTRGAQTAGYGVDPDMAFIFDVTDSNDVPGGEDDATCCTGKGPAVMIMDRSVMCHPAVIEIIEKTAKESKIKVQKDVCLVGGTDGGPIHKGRGGVPTGGISLPLRYMHTPQEMACIKDIEEGAELIAAVVSKA